MGPDGKSSHSSDWGPHAAENQAPGPWGAVLTPREEKKTGLGLLPPHQGHPDLGVRAIPTVSQRRGCPPDLARACAVPSRRWGLGVQRLGWCAGGCKALLPLHLCSCHLLGPFSITLQLCRWGVLPVGGSAVGPPRDSTQAVL